MQDAPLGGVLAQALFDERVVVLGELVRVVLVDVAGRGLLL